MKNYRIFESLLITFITCGCSPDPVDIANEKWKCYKESNIKNCTVEFSATNKSHLPTQSIIRIRAHRRQSVLGSDAIQNVVVGDKVLNIKLNPEESLLIKEAIQPNDRVTNIVVTVKSNEY